MIKGENIVIEWWQEVICRELNDILEVFKYYENIH